MKTMPDDEGLQAPQRSLRDAMVLVPREPTTAMIEAGIASVKGIATGGWHDDMRRIFPAMIGAYESSVSPYLRQRTRSGESAALDTAIEALTIIAKPLIEETHLERTIRMAAQTALNRIRALVPDKGSE